jgi:hypothetical protein
MSPEKSLTAMAERHHIGDVMGVGFADGLGATEASFVFAGFVAEQMTLAGAAKHHFAGRADFEPLLGGFLGLG